MDRHHELEDRLHELTSKHYLSTPEQLEEVNLKKQKRFRFRDSGDLLRKIP